jgi:hypothetical protein
MQSFNTDYSEVEVITVIFFLYVEVIAVNYCNNTSTRMSLLLAKFPLNNSSTTTDNSRFLVVVTVNFRKRA